MLDEFKSHLDNSFPLLGSTPFLLACSGGVDSIVLGHLCQELDLDFAVAHCNFGLRGHASNGDAEFVGDLARKWNKEYFLTHFDTIGYANKNKVSIQVAARELRYHWFARIQRKTRYGRLVTAHHADDDLETFLINLSRGTGLDGLIGMPSNTDALARPLLAFDRAWVMRYAEAHGLEWREDETNNDIKYVRNRIRHVITPELVRVHPNFSTNFRMTQRHLKQASDVLESYVGGLRRRLLRPEGRSWRISIKDLLALDPLPGHLYQLLKPYGFTAWADVQNLLTAMSGKEVRSSTHRLIKDRDSLLLSTLERIDKDVYELTDSDTHLDIPVPMSISTVDSIAETGPHVLYVAKETLKYPLLFRKWTKGDYFYPFGMKGRKKVSKYFKDEKMDALAKENQWLLCSGSEIVWVVGRRADERFKVTDSTSEIIKLELNL